MNTTDPTTSRTRDHTELIEKQRIKAANGFGTRLGLDLVDLFVGPDRKQFKVHRALFCSRVPYFASMFDGGFIEARENAASFPEDDPDVFELFVEWVYTGGYQSIGTDISDDEWGSSLTIRLGLYALARKMCLPLLEDLTITVVISNLAAFGLIPGAEFVQKVYDTVDHDSPMVKFMRGIVYYQTCVLPDGGVGDWASEQKVASLIRNPDLLRDVIEIGVSRENGIEDRNPFEDPYDLPFCSFHLHEEGEECQFDEAIF